MGRVEEVDVVIGVEGGVSSFVRRWLFDGRSDVYYCDCKWFGEIWGCKVGWKFEGIVEGVFCGYDVREDVC